MKAESPHRLHSNLSIRSPRPPPKHSRTNTWASIAATAPANVNPLVKFTPEDAVRRNVTEVIGEQQPTINEDERVVWVQPWAPSRPLTDISNTIKGLGAIFSIAYAPSEQAVCIIFQHARCTAQFLQDHAEYVSRTGLNKFGPGVTVLAGHPFQTNNDFMRMEPPLNERRRLTFARQQLFSNGMTEKRFTADLETIVGAANIELVWLFNTGNGR